MRFGGGVSEAARVWLTAAVVMVVMVLAASSGPVRLWAAPSGGAEQPVADVDPLETVLPAVQSDDDGGDVASYGLLFDVIAGVVIAVLAVAAGAFALRELGPGLWTGGPRRLRRRREKIVEVLSDGSQSRMAVDIDTARAVLSAGSPRNAIVACWMQLERDAAAVGLARFEAETSSEYVERVVAASSISSGPITELAGLYHEARFSRHELTDAHRARAAEVLGGVVVALDQRSVVS